MSVATELLTQTKIDRVEELRRELATDLGDSTAVRAMARDYARQEAVTDDARRKLREIAAMLPGVFCLECDMAVDFATQIQEVLDS